MSKSEPQKELGHLAKGDVISVPIPYPDIEGESKRRPALILMRADGDNFVVCPFTTKPNRPHKILIENKHFKVGRFDTYDASFLRPNLIHTINRKHISRKYGTLHDEIMMTIINKMIELLNQPAEAEPASSKALERPKAPKRVR